jgi:hypothetical protein
MNFIKKLIDGYILKQVIKSEFRLTEKDKDYLKKLGRTQPELIRILEKMSTAVVIGAVNAKSTQGFVRMSEWVECFRVLTGYLTAEEKKKINRVKNEKVN